ncbi:MAG: Dinitrogenase iron-molybdenum cofactor [Firmicutes bacterium ADurb.Bin456]|nr:MAG: Dinitrogenase iron-molybdenum cofactor [Firmicutes bacterium ADurb.Bin456]
MSAGKAGSAALSRGKLYKLGTGPGYLSKIVHKILRNGGKPMKIAMPCLDGNVNPHFGSSRQFIVFDTAGGQIKGKKTIDNETLHNHGGLARILKDEGVEVVITGGIGRPMINALHEAGFKVITGASGEVDRIANDFINGQLLPSPAICSCGGKHGQA